jgi:hypothetical protein
MLNGESKIVVHGKARTQYFTVPAKVAGDSTYPFRGGEVVSVRIEGDGLRVEKA